MTFQNLTNEDATFLAEQTNCGFVATQELEQFFAAVGKQLARAEKKQRKLDRRTATGFNVFDLIDPDENKLSDILKDLLDPKGIHGQGDLFLRLLFEQLDMGSHANSTRNAKVQREAPTYRIKKYRRRMDVLVEAGAILAIENKVASPEEPDQVKDYLEHLRHCTQNNQKNSVLIYLTPERRRPDSLTPDQFNEAKSYGILRCWSYQVEIREWLENCRRNCQANKIKIFLTDFIAYIESHLSRKQATGIEEEEANEN